MSLKRAQNEKEKEKIMKKTAMVQSQQYTQAFKIYTSSAWHAHDILHICLPLELKLYSVRLKVKG